MQERIHQAIGLSRDGMISLTRLRRVAALAVEGQGLGNSDIGFGFAFEGGQVFLYGPGVPSSDMEAWEAYVEEAAFLTEVERILTARGLTVEAAALRERIGSLDAHPGS